jgi:hypothetical protein
MGPESRDSRPWLNYFAAPRLDFRPGTPDSFDVRTLRAEEKTHPEIDPSARQGSARQARQAGPNAGFARNPSHFILHSPFSIFQSPFVIEK